MVLLNEIEQMSFDIQPMNNAVMPYPRTENMKSTMHLISAHE